MRQLLQHRLKTKIQGGGEASHQKRGQYIKRFVGQDIPLQFIQGWTGLENCGAVQFNGVNVTNNGEQVTNNP